MVVRSHPLSNLEVNSHAMVLAMHADNVGRETPCILHRPARPIYNRIFLACLSLLTSHAVYAEAGDTFTPYVGYGIFSTDNITRQPDNGNRESDTWTRATVGLRFDKTISRQRLTADASLNETKYDHFRQFDNDGRKLGANWNWVLGNRLSGNIGTTFLESLPPFLDVGPDGEPLPASVRTQKSSFINGGWHLHPSWRITAAFNRDDIDYEDIPSQKFQLDTAEFGLNYVPKSGNKIGLLVRHGVGDYPNQPPGNTSNYTQDEVKANVNWQITGKTNLQFLGGWAQRNFESGTDRNYSGPDARLTANWAATGKTALTLALWRTLGSANVRSAGDVVDVGAAPDYIYSNYSRNTGASMGANWQATNKITVDALTSSEERNYNRIDRADRYQRSSVGLTYLPLRQWSIRMSAYQQQLKSNVGTASSYRTNGFQLSTRYEF